MALVALLASFVLRAQVVDIATRLGEHVVTDLLAVLIVGLALFA